MRDVMGEGFCYGCKKSICFLQTVMRECWHYNKCPDCGGHFFAWQELELAEVRIGPDLIRFELVRIRCRDCGKVFLGRPRALYHGACQGVEFQTDITAGRMVSTDHGNLRSIDKGKLMEEP